MQQTRPYVVSLAGFDPSGGAGVLADCKTFEQQGVYGLGVCTALTAQTDNQFLSVHWLSTEQIMEQLQPLIKRFAIAACKIGIIQSPDTLLEIIRIIKQQQPAMRIVWDPVLKASAGYDLHKGNCFHKLDALLAVIDLITPNYEELQQLQDCVHERLIKKDRAVAGAILLKGGHRPDALGTDTLYEQHSHTIIPAGVNSVFPKHGSGCVLSAAITAQLALGNTLPTACRKAKQYIETYLNSNQLLLGYHTVC